jgi:transcriptional regulator of heat shock response
MKILILYTPRSGTNSIAEYFLKQNPNYKYFNQPFSPYVEPGIKKVSYNECIKYNNILIKNDITSFKLLKINKEKIINDFDKVLLISRKNKIEQSISFMIAKNNKNFLDKTKRKYNFAEVDKEIIEEGEEAFKRFENMLYEFKDISFRFFYYEDLFYGNFNELFDYLNIKYVKDDFENILNKNNKYNIGYTLDGNPIEDINNI